MKLKAIFADQLPDVTGFAMGLFKTLI